MTPWNICASSVVTSLHHDVKVMLPVLWGWLLVVVLATLLAGGIWDGAGRQEHEHPGPIPAQVQRMSPSIYFLPFDIALKPDDICGTISGETGVSSTTPEPRLSGSIVVCGEAQQWNVHKGASVDMSHALLRLIVHPAYIGSFILVTLFFFAFPGIPFYVRHVKPWREARRTREQTKQAAQINAERKRVEMGILGTPWRELPIWTGGRKPPLRSITNARGRCLGNVCIA
jgi:hypothetical protein